MVFDLGCEFFSQICKLGIHVLGERMTAQEKQQKSDNDALKIHIFIGLET
jgi:hypothetical protein